MPGVWYDKINEIIMLTWTIGYGYRRYALSLNLSVTDCVCDCASVSVSVSVSACANKWQNINFVCLLFAFVLSENVYFVCFHVFCN